jgi:hypothetical protein
MFANLSISPLLTVLVLIVDVPQRPVAARQALEKRTFADFSVQPKAAIET